MALAAGDFAQASDGTGEICGLPNPFHAQRISRITTGATLQLGNIVGIPEVERPDHIS